MKRATKDLRTHRMIPPRYVTSRLRLGLVACLVAGIIQLSSGPALGQDVTSEAPDPMAWSEWLQQHRELEYPVRPGVLAWPDSTTVADWLQDHRELEYPESQGS